MVIIKVNRKTKETDIKLKLNLHGAGKTEIDTGIPFFDHMLTLMAFNAGFDLDLKSTGDLATGKHHLVEDIGISIGQAVDKALGKRQGIKRYGFFRLPMDEALAETVIDISGRPYVKLDSDFGKIGKKDMDTGFDFGLVEDFLWGIARNAKLTLHASVPYGKNNHHKIEALFKCLGRAIKDAVSTAGNEMPSTKGRI